MRTATKPRAVVPDELMRTLAEFASRLTGFRPDAIPAAALRTIAARNLAEGVSAAKLSRLAATSDAPLGHELVQAVPVGETYFFRHPEQFDFLARDILPRAASKGRVRCWSAGTATGEEAYSLAACAVAAAPSTVNVRVLGTDIVAASLDIARRGHYGRWSTRDSGPLLYRLLSDAPGGGVRVADDIRSRVSFEIHNLLSAPIEREFDVILCRNVLVYFDRAMATKVCARLTSALADDGTIIFGSMDLIEPPAELTAVGSPTLHAYVKSATRPPERRSRKPRSTKIPRPVPLPGPPPAPPIDVIGMHMAALAFIERDDPSAADDVLEQITRSDRAYLPALVERALLHQRYDRGHRATDLMNEALRLLSALPVDHIVAGPHPMTVRDYRELVRGFLDKRGRR